MVGLNNLLHIGIILFYFADFLHAEELWESSSQLILMKIYNKKVLHHEKLLRRILIVFEPLKFSYLHWTVSCGA